MATPEEWYRSLPPVTRGYMTSAVAATLIHGGHQDLEVAVNGDLQRVVVMRGVVRRAGLRLGNPR